MVATLTGERSMARIAIIADSFLLWATTCGIKFESCIAAWQEFYVSPSTGGAANG